jgi:hypothetical protein
MPSTSWSAPATFASGDTLTAAQMNVISDDLKFLKNVDRVRVYKSAAQTVASGAWEHLSFDSEDYDTNTMHSTSSNTQRLTATVDGWYVACLQVSFAASGANRRDIQIRKNDSSTDGSAGTRWARVTLGALGAGDSTIMQCSAYLYLSATDYVKGLAWQNSGAGLDVESGSATTWFSLTWLGD